MRILIIEDELLIAKKLQKLVMELEPSAEITETTNCIASTVRWLQVNKHPDLILMDIELADGQCFDIFKQVEIKSPVIFTTAYDDFALKAFKVNSIDYLLKPIKSDELRNALNKFHSLSSAPAASDTLLNYDKLLSVLQKLPAAKNYRDRFLVKQGQKSFSISSNEVAYFFTEKSINYLLTQNKKKYIIDYTLDEVEQSLDPARFYRANRQTIVSSAAVMAMHPWFNGKLKLELNPDHEEHVLISREKAGEFKQWMGE
jgi:two-component system LytT family response regulator